MGILLVSNAPPTSLQDIGRVSGELSCIYDDSTETLSRRDSHTVPLPNSDTLLNSDNLPKNYNYTLTLPALPDSDTLPNSGNLPNNYTLLSSDTLLNSNTLPDSGVSDDDDVD